MNIDSFLKEMREKRVEYIWHMNRSDFERLKKEKDELGSFLMLPPSLNGTKEFTFMGLRVFLKEYVERPTIAIILPPDTECYGDEDWVSQ